MYMRKEWKMESNKLKPGDMLLVHNFTGLQERSGFTDDPDSQKSRLILRLGYDLPGGRVEATPSSKERPGYFTGNPYVIRHHESRSLILPGAM